MDKHKKDPTFLEEIRGSWIENICIGNKLYWDEKAQIPEFIKQRVVCHLMEDLGKIYACFGKVFMKPKMKKKEKYMKLLVINGKL